MCPRNQDAIKEYNIVAYYRSSILYYITIMTGGLLQIASYGNQDIFITGAPQITFFKVVYRRHINFAIESIQQDLIGDINFGAEMSSIIEKVGDLMYKVYLEVEIPKINLVKDPSQWRCHLTTIKAQLNELERLHQLMDSYLSMNTEVIKKVILLVRASSPLEELIAHVNSLTQHLHPRRRELEILFAENSNLNLIDELRDKKDQLIIDINQMDIGLLFNSVVHQVNYSFHLSPIERNSLVRKRLLDMINHDIYPVMRRFYQEIYSLLVHKQGIYQSMLNGSYVERYQFAWVEELGHAIIDQLDIRIGNQLIDRHTGDWLIIFNKLFMNEYQKNNYNKMIGNVSELTNFNDAVKPSYQLIIPFQFWFCRHQGLALPLVALQYHDVMFNIKLKNLLQLCYFEEGLPATNLQSQYAINLINARLWVDYVFLDTVERTRFAQSISEYLIEFVQFNEFSNFTGTKYLANLTMAHATKFIVWFLQPNRYRNNPSGSNKSQWNNYGTKPDLTGYSIQKQYLRLNTCPITDPSHDVVYLNYVQPYLYFPHSPTDGLYCYSFALEPVEHQPSGTCNFSRLDDISIVIEFSDDFINLINNFEDSGGYLGVYAVSYNVLRIISGMAGLAFAGV